MYWKINSSCSSWEVSLPRWALIISVLLYAASNPPSKLIVWVAVIGCLACLLYLYAIDRDVIHFAGLNDTYMQSKKRAATSFFVGYCQVYLACFFSLVLFSFGLLYKRPFLLVLGGAGFALIYMIMAERTVILLPFALWGVVQAFRMVGYGAIAICSLFVGGALLVLGVSLFCQDLYMVAELGKYVFMQLIAIPGLFVTQYFYFFSDQGYTHWSHVSVISHWVNMLEAYVGDEKWPALGKILAERVLCIISQSNAGFFAKDAFAAWGSLGVFLICMLYGTWLVVLDWMSKGTDRLFLLVALFPLAFVSTNGFIFTMMSSFGGALWIALLWLNRRRFRFAERGIE